MTDDPMRRVRWATATGERLETILLVAEDGSTHRYRWNPESRAYDIDLGPVVPSRYPEEEP